MSASADAPVADAAPAPLVLEATDAAPQGPRRSESGESADPSPKPADLQALWNEFAVPAGLPAWDSPTTGQRLAHAKARLAERPAWTLRGPADSWEALLKRIAASDFLAGRANGFRASSGWVLKPENFAKVLEGNYDNREAPALRRQPANAISAAAKAEFANSPKGIQDDF